MRITRASIALSIFTVLLLLATGIAFGDTGFFSVGSFSSTYSAGALHTQFTLVQGYGIYDWTGYSWPTVPVVVEVVRRAISDPCGTETRVTYLPWNQQGVPLVTGDIMDTNVEANTSYQYLAYGIDGQGARMAPIAMIGVASTGFGLLCHGVLSNIADCGVSGVWRAVACYNECAGSLLLESAPPDALPYFNTTTTLAIYGEVAGLSPALCNVVEPWFKITSVVEQSCVVAVEPVTWGAVKAMYK